MSKTNVVAFVPIKLKSQRLPGKNLLQFGGRSLCWHIFACLLGVEGIKDVYVYCSDKSVLKHLPDGVKFLRRSQAFDSDECKGLEIYKAFAAEVVADIYVLAHATSPLLKSSTVSNALTKVLFENYDSAFSARKIQTFVWFRSLPLNYNPTDIPRTQDIDPVFAETSGFFVFQRDILVEKNQRIGSRPFIQEVDPIEAIDIDTEEDFVHACTILQGTTNMKATNFKV